MTARRWQAWRLEAREPVRYVQRQVTLEGRFEILPDDPSGIVYRLLDAQPTS